jgi:hypothetical protein
MATRNSNAKDSSGEVVTVTVRATRDGFRRCGMAFGKNPIEVTVSLEDAETLRAEPMLIVTEAAE